MAEEYANEDAGLKPDEECTLEEAFARAEALIRRLEQPDLPLEEAFALYERGMALLKMCSDRIDRVEKQMITLRAESSAQAEE